MNQLRLRMLGRGGSVVSIIRLGVGNSIEGVRSKNEWGGHEEIPGVPAT